MKPFLILMTSLITFLLSVHVYGDEADITITIDQEQITYNDDYGYPFVDSHHRTQVPLRKTLEAIGAQVEWQQVKRQAVIRYRDQVVIVPLGENFIQVNEVVHPMDTEAVIKDQRLYLPVRFILEAFNYEVAWESAIGGVVAKPIESLDILFLGDPQGYKQSQYDQLGDTIGEARSQFEPDMILMAGDLVDRGDNADQWGFFHKVMDPIIAEIPFYPAQGNHDVKGSNDLYLSAFDLPFNGIDSTYETYYVDTPFARIAVMNSERTETFEDQEAWLLEIMADSDQAFQIVMLHRPPYAMMYNEAYIRALTPTFEAAGIDLVLSGHDHIYSRTTMWEGQINPKGITYVVGGSSSGSKYYTEETGTDRYWRDVVYDEDNPVFVHLTIRPETIQMTSYALLDEGSEVMDTWTIEP